MFNLNQLPGLTDLGPEELMQLKDRMDMLMERVLDGNDYFDPGALVLMDPSQAYSLNIDELWVRQVPYIHKIFVVLLVSVQSGKLTLVYAASRCGMPKKRKYISNADDLQGVLLMVLRQVPNHLYRNVVAIVSDRAPVNMQALKSLRRYIKSPTVIYDGTHLMRTLNKKECPDPFATQVLQELLSTLYEKETFRNHLYMIRDSCRSRKYENLALIWDFVSAAEDILKNVFAIDGNQFNLSSLINDRLEQYGMVAIRHVPQMSLEESSSVTGIAAFLVYEATKYMDGE